MNNNQSTTAIRGQLQPSKKQLFCFWEKLFWTKKHQCAQFVFFRFHHPEARTAFWCLETKPVSCKKVLSEVFACFVLFKLWNHNVHHFCPISDTQKTGTKFKKRFLQKNSGLRATKTLIVWKMHFPWHTNLQRVTQVFMCLKNGHPKQGLFKKRGLGC